MKSALPPAGSSGALRTIASTQTGAGTFPPLSFAPETGSSLPTRVPVRCNQCETVILRPRTHLQRVKPGTPLYCSQPCRYGATHVALTCEGCGTGYTRLRCEVEKAARKGFARSFCSKACFSAAEQQAHAAKRPCAACGNPRPVTRERFCSDACQERFYVSLADCDHCGKSFELPRWELAKKRRLGRNVYCSRPCVSAGIAATLAKATCQGCGAKMPRPWNGRRFCTAECRAAHQASTRKLPDSVCTECGTVFRLRSSRMVYCSAECADSAHSLRMIGTGNSRYQTGTSYADWFRKMRPLIIQRDGGVCVACRQLPPPTRYLRKGVPTERSSLLVHHIDERPANNRPENLIALCKTCHMIHHKSATTPFPWFAAYAVKATRSTTSRWKATVTSLQVKYSSTTASSSMTPSRTRNKQARLTTVIASGNGGSP